MFMMRLSRLISYQVKEIQKNECRWHPSGWQIAMITTTDNRDAILWNHFCFSFISNVPIWQIWMATSCILLWSQRTLQCGWRTHMPFTNANNGQYVSHCKHIVLLIRHRFNGNKQHRKSQTRSWIGSFKWVNF